MSNCDGAQCLGTRGNVRLQMCGRSVRNCHSRGAYAARERRRQFIEIDSSLSWFTSGRLRRAFSVRSSKPIFSSTKISSRQPSLKRIGYPYFVIDMRKSWRGAQGLRVRRCFAKKTLTGRSPNRTLETTKGAALEGPLHGISRNAICTARWNIAGHIVTTAPTVQNCRVYTTVWRLYLYPSVCRPTTACLPRAGRLRTITVSAASASLKNLCVINSKYQAEMPPK